MAGDGWLVGGVDPAGSYFAFPAPNGGSAFSAVDAGQGGPNQGLQQLSVYNDYNNPFHQTGGNVQAFVFRDIGLFDSSDAGLTYNFSFDGKTGNLVPPTIADARITVLNPNTMFSQTDLVTLDTTALGASWQEGLTLSVSVPGDGSWTGQLLQVGFTSTTTNFVPSGNFYDNINVVGVPEPSSLAALAIGSTAMFVRRRRRS